MTMNRVGTRAGILASILFLALIFIARSEPDDVRVRPWLLGNTAAETPVMFLLRDPDVGTAMDQRPFAVTTRQRGARVFFTSQGLSIVHSALVPGQRLAGSESPHGGGDDRIALHRIDLRFIDCAIPDIEMLNPCDERRWVYTPDAESASGEAFGGVRYRNIYPGIDAECFINERGLKYQFIVHPGADARRIRLSVEGAGAASVARDGSLRYDCDGWTLTDAAPVAFTAGDHPLHVKANWRLEGRTLGFAVGATPEHAVLVIDPFLQWSTFLGGDLSDYARDVAVDAEGSMLVCGYTASLVFPVTPGAMQTSAKGNFDLFIAKFSRERKRVWTTLFGGSGSEENPQIALSARGDVVVAGSTSSIDIPVSPGAVQSRNGGRYDVFLLSLDAAGQRRWCTYLGGSFSDECGGLDIDANGRVHIAGGTYSTNFPVTPDAFQTSNAGDYDMFVAIFDANGSRAWATYIGGWSMDFATDIAVAPNGDAVIAVRTESTNLPAVSTGMQQSYGGGSFDAALLRIDGRSRKIAWATYLGGELEDSAERVAIDVTGNIAVAGYTASVRFPVKGASVRNKHGGLIDAFVTVFGAKGDLQWSTYLGGNEVDKAGGLDIDPQGNIVVSGFTASTDFPLAGTPFQREKGKGYDAFIIQFAKTGALLWGSFFGGEGHDISHGLSVDSKGNAAVVGGTESRGFRTAGNTFQGDLAGLTDAFMLRIVFNEPLANAGPDTTICLGTSVSLGGDAGGGQPPYLYSWSPVEGLKPPDAQRPLASPTRTTWYVMTVTDAEGAISRDTVLVSVVAPPVADAGEPVAICPGSSVQLKGKANAGTPPYNFNWSPADGLSSAAIPAPVAAPRITTRYTLTVTDAKGCSHSDAVVVTVHPALSISAGEDRIACANTPMSLRAAVMGGKAPFRYSWSPAPGMSDASASEPRFTPRSSGALTVTVTDANGCTAMDTVRLTVHPPPVVDAGDNLSLCTGEQSGMQGRVSGGRPPYIIKWNPGDGLSSTITPTPRIAPSRTALYTLTVTDANGCVAIDSVLVSVHPQPSLRVQGDVTACAGVPLRIGAEAMGGTPPFRYSWVPSTGLDNATSAIPSATPQKNTTYTVTARDANGCTATTMVRVTVQPKPVLRIADRVTLCRGSSTELSAAVRGGSPPYVYSWSPLQGLSSGTIPNPRATPAVTSTYTLTVTDAVGCVAQGSVDVAILDPPVVDAGADVSLCSGSQISLNARISGGSPPYKFTWSPATGLSSARSLNPNVSVVSTTVYTLTATDTRGCVATDVVTVFATSSPVVRAGADVTICSGNSYQIPAQATGGTPPYSWRWTPAFGLDNASIPTPTAAPTSSTQYTVMVTDARGCTASDQVTVSVAPAPGIILPREMTVCRGQGKRIELSVSGGTRPYRYEWTPREGLSDPASPTPVANPVQTITYTVTVIDAKGCRARATIVVAVTPCNKADAGSDADLCLGEQVRLGSGKSDTTNGAVFTWTPADGLRDARSPSPLASPTASTMYVLQVRNAFGCVDADTVRIKVRPVPSVQANEDVTLCPGGTAQLAAQVKGGKAPYRFAWSPAVGLSRPNAARTTAQPGALTLYTVTVTDATGCIARDSVFVAVSQPPLIAMSRKLTVCEGLPVQLGGSVSGGTPPFGFFWSPPEGLDNRNKATPVATPRRSMTYTVTVTDANGCQMTDTVQLIAQPVPVVAIVNEGGSGICEGQTLTLRATPGFTKYKWSDGTEGPSLAVREPGEYSVSAWSSVGCEGRSSAIGVSVYPVPTPVISALGPLRFCEGDSVVLDAGSGYTLYHWSTGAVSRSISVHRSGDYSVTVKGKGNCEAVAANVHVTVDTAPVATIVQRGDTLIAFQSTAYQWFRDGQEIPGARNRILVAERSGSYQVLVRNEQGCSAKSEARVIRTGALNTLPAFRTGFCSASKWRMEESGRTHRWVTCRSVAAGSRNGRNIEGIHSSGRIASMR